MESSATLFHWLFFSFCFPTQIYVKCQRLIYKLNTKSLSIMNEFYRSFYLYNCQRHITCSGFPPSGGILWSVWSSQIQDNESNLKTRDMKNRLQRPEGPGVLNQVAQTPQRPGLRIMESVWDHMRGRQRRRQDTETDQIHRRAEAGSKRSLEQLSCSEPEKLWAVRPRRTGSCLKGGGEVTANTDLI